MGSKGLNSRWVCSANSDLLVGFIRVSFKLNLRNSVHTSHTISYFLTGFMDSKLSSPKQSPLLLSLARSCTHSGGGLWAGMLLWQPAKRQVITTHFHCSIVCCINWLLDTQAYIKFKMDWTKIKLESLHCIISALLRQFCAMFGYVVVMLRVPALFWLNCCCQWWDWAGECWGPLPSAPAQLAPHQPAAAPEEEWNGAETQGHHHAAQWWEHSPYCLDHYGSVMFLVFCICVLQNITWLSPTKYFCFIRGREPPAPRTPVALWGQNLLELEDLSYIELYDQYKSI